MMKDDDYCGTQRCKDLGCFGYCDYAKKQETKAKVKNTRDYHKDDMNGYKITK